MRIATYWVVSWHQGGIYHTELFHKKDLAQAYAGNLNLEDDVTEVEFEPVYSEQAI